MKLFKKKRQRRSQNFARENSLIFVKIAYEFQSLTNCLKSSIWNVLLFSEYVLVEVWSKLQISKYVQWIFEDLRVMLSQQYTFFVNSFLWKFISADR